MFGILFSYWLQDQFRHFIFVRDQKCEHDGEVGYFYTKHQYDQDYELCNDLWDVQVLLHELSHGSGKLYKHIFVM